MAAARYWAKGGKQAPNPEQAAQDEADRKVFGCCASDLDDPAEPDPDFEIYADNLDSIEAFIRCADRWEWMVVGTKAIRIKLDMQEVRLVLWGLNVKQPRQVFNDLLLMEGAALKAFSEEK